jgi:CHASE2 domain-containing sensor protein
MTRASQLVRLLVLRSGKGTKWDLLKAMTISGLAGLSLGLLAYGWPSPKVMLAVLFTMGMAILFFMLAGGKLLERRS